MCKNAETPYTYLFIRKDLPMVQQIIQTAHAIHQMGTKQGDKTIPHATLIGVDDKHELLELAAYLKDQKIKYEMFFEPDIDEYTAIATYPLKGHQRDPLQGFELLRIDEANA
jgi:hypothetical protein